MTKMSHKLPFGEKADHYDSLRRNDDCALIGSALNNKYMNEQALKHNVIII